jgi:hypothetical protein
MMTDDDGARDDGGEQLQTTLDADDAQRRW